MDQPKKSVSVSISSRGQKNLNLTMYVKMIQPRYSYQNTLRIILLNKLRTFLTHYLF